MSTQRGNGSRTRAQKHKNRTVFKNDLHDKTMQQKRLNTMQVSEVCQHCKGVIEWKIKYKKYKPLTQPKTCTRCQLRKVIKAYHVLCRDCARETRSCAKCLKGDNEVLIEAPAPTTEEEQKLKTEMDRLIKSFPERKRRAFLRYMEKGKKQEENVNETDEGNVERLVNDDNCNRISHTREELLQKIEQLKVTNGIGSDLDSDEFDDSDEEIVESDEQDEKVR